MYIRRSFRGKGLDTLAAMVAEAKRWSLEVQGGERLEPEGRTPCRRSMKGQRSPASAGGAVRACRWSRPKVGQDAHAKVGRTLYSLPYRLIGRHVDARATAVVVQFYLDGELVKTHPFQARGRRTDRPICPNISSGSSCATRRGVLPRRPWWARRARP